ncbi:MAG: CoA-binding protein [Bacteroidota bacterium]
MKTLVLGASTHPSRYSFIAINDLLETGHEVVAVGKDKGEVNGVKIMHDFPADGNIDTVTMYLNPVRQKEYYDKIVSLKPRRIIFNPGAENPELAKLARENGIKTENACTLVLLSTGQY